MRQEEKAMWECYRRLFSQSTPSGDFDKLVENATINDRGQKEIPFMDYEIDESVCMEIIEKTLKDFKIKKYLHSRFKTTILLGCSPKFKVYEKDRIA